jgi:hypothetical protein
MDSGWRHACSCPYTAVDFQNGNAPSVVTLPEQRGDVSTNLPHDPYMDDPMPVDAVECTCVHLPGHAPDETGRCRVLGCECTWTGQA